MKSDSPAPLGTRIFIILAITAIIICSGLLVLLARSCGADEPAPLTDRGTAVALFQAAGDDIIHHAGVCQG